MRRFLFLGGLTLINLALAPALLVGALSYSAYRRTIPGPK